MIIEIRNYKIRTGQRDKFIEFFETKALPLQEKFGMKILGQFINEEDPDSFVWLRAFKDEKDREIKKKHFYESPL